MERLGEKVQIRGTGIPGLTARLIERTDKVALYRRSDGVWEVFLIRIAPEEIIQGHLYPEREVYPGNEDFGSSAWCYTSEKEARKKFNEILARKRVRTSQFLTIS